MRFKKRRSHDSMLCPIAIHCDLTQLHCHSFDLLQVCRVTLTGQSSISLRFGGRKPFQEAFFVEVELLANEGHGCVLAAWQLTSHPSSLAASSPSSPKVAGRSDVESGWDPQSFDSNV